MDLPVSTILQLSPTDFYKLSQTEANFSNLFLRRYVNEIKEKINARMQIAWRTIELINIQQFFPTMQEVDMTIKDPFYVRCIKSPNDYVVGYTGYKKDASDKGFSSFPGIGINLWILIYDPRSNLKSFMFIKVENFFEIGTKHGMLLHLVAQTFPTLKIISAGEVKVEEMILNDQIFYKLTWNASSGTITKALFDMQPLQLSFLSILYPEKNFSEVNLRLRPSETLVNIISKIEFGYELKNYPVKIFIPIYENIILGMLQNFLSKILMEKVIPFAFPHVPTINEFQYLQLDYDKPINLVMPTFVHSDPSTTIDMVASSNCANPYIRNNLYVFANDTDCKSKINNTPVFAPRYCDLLPKSKANPFANRPLAQRQAPESMDES